MRSVVRLVGSRAGVKAGPAPSSSRYRGGVGHERPVRDRCHPPEGGRRRARVVVRDRESRNIITTCYEDLEDAAGRRRAARDICAKVGGDPVELEKRINERWAEALSKVERAPPEEPNAPAGPSYHDSD